MPANASSSRFVTVDSRSPVDVPGAFTVTTATGNAVSGLTFTGSFRKAKQPPNVSAMNSTMVGIGDRIAQAEMFISRPSRPAPWVRAAFSPRPASRCRPACSEPVASETAVSGIADASGPAAASRTA